MKITIFGGANPRPGEPAYEEAYRLGQLLGRSGHTVLTGGYIGTMEAVSRGAAEQGGHVIGVTCEEIEKWRPVSPNGYITEHMRFPTLGARVTALIFNCDVAIALPGGVGTLAEVALFWNHVIIEAIPPRPLVLVGSGWKKTFETYLAELGMYIREKDQNLLNFVPTVEAAYERIHPIDPTQNK